MSHFPQKSNHGTTTQRPTLAAADKGYEYFDVTLGYPVWWDGAAWVEAAAPGQVATVEFSGASQSIDEQGAPPTSINMIRVTTSDLAVTEEDIVVSIVDAGTGSAVAPGQYVAGPWGVTIPAGTAHNALVAFSFSHVQDPAEVPAIPPDVDIDIEIDLLTSLQTTAIGPANAMTINLFHFEA